MRSEEKARVDVPPAGLFGSVGLQLDAPAGPPDPFERVVPGLRGRRRFADIVSWNIEHLHSEANFRKIPRIAEFMRACRCDFWGLQEVDQVSLGRLAETINSSGQTRYDFVAIPGNGQQSGALFRVDTTAVEVLDIPEGFFQGKLDVELTNGTTVERSVFLRKPLLCDVRVRQSDSKEFDFRCAIVHLKSTDTKIKDKGNSIRQAAAEELVRWLRTDMEAGLERDYLILGDMNAETSQQGLGAFVQDENLKLLSVGMQDKFGTAEALTRVASERLLDHIVVTEGAVPLMPEEDEAEQIIIRSDTKIAEWTENFSDHVPVAVRFVIGVDQD